MIPKDEVDELISEIHKLVLNNEAYKKDPEFWHESAAKSMIFIDELIKKSEAVNSFIPKNYDISLTQPCILEVMFEILDNIPDVNVPFKNCLWERHIQESSPSDNESTFSNLATSTYELIFSRCCSLISQMLGDRFPYVQKLLIKNLFSQSHIKSILSSDIYMFIMRLFNNHQQTAMCQLIMNLCKHAPPDGLAKGAALINRIKHPFINFESPRYQYLLDFGDRI